MNETAVEDALRSIEIFLHQEKPRKPSSKIFGDFATLENFIRSHFDRKRKAARLRSLAVERKRKFIARFRGSGKELTVSSISELAKITGYTANTVRVYLCRGEGVATFVVGDEVVTVERVAKEKS